MLGPLILGANIAGVIYKWLREEELNAGRIITVQELCDVCRLNNL